MPLPALIVAAGFGSRLRAVSPSKPLTQVAGVPLIERVLAAAIEAGVDDVTVVTGHEAEAVERHLNDAARRLSIRVRCVRTEDWARPNGFSVLSGAAAIGARRHLLMMADHIVSPALVAAVADAPADALVLGVDRRLDNPLVDMDDVTRVATRGDTIVAIGKHLDAYDAFDTGVFAVDGRFHAALAQDIAQGGAGSISAGVTALARRGEARAVDVSQHWWLDVDDARALAQAEAAIAAHANRLAA